MEEGKEKAEKSEEEGIAQSDLIAVMALLVALISMLMMMF